MKKMSPAHRFLVQSKLLTTTPDTHTPPSTPITGDDSADGGALAPSVPRLPSSRAIAMLAAGMLVLGLAVGAAIGPTPSPSLAGPNLPLLMSSLGRIAASRAAQSTAGTIQPPPAAAEATPTRERRRRRRKRTAKGSSSSATATPISTPKTTTKTTTPASTTPASTTKPSTLPPITSVWLITLSGATFAQALAQPAAAPYIDSELVPAGTLESSWSALDGSSVASEAGLLAGTPPQTLDSIVQPPCPEGAAGAQCAPETAGALSAADEFLKQTVPAITSSAAYRAHGLIVISFATIGNATASSLPVGASTATLSSEVPAGVLLLSPFAKAGARPASTFNPTSPKQSLSGLLH
jgi:hypothetical protein